MNRFRVIVLALVLFHLLFLFTGVLWADGPQMVNYQGKLLESGEIVDGVKAIGYKIFKGSTTAWTQVPHDVSIYSGIFSDQLDLSTGFIPG
ncbi:hypothetical protein JXI42_08995 [bacterium]|nr:hypothetical protein [bacterium]